MTAWSTNANTPRGYYCSQRLSCSQRQFCGECQFATAEEIMNRILESAPGTFGKLVVLASLCRCRADESRDPEFDDFVPPCLASLVLRSNHERLFSKWLELVLEEQWKEISDYLAARAVREVRGDKELGDSWELLIPQAARDPERALFLADLELVLNVVHR